MGDIFTRSEKQLKKASELIRALIMEARPFLKNFCEFQEVWTPPKSTRLLFKACIYASTNELHIMCLFDIDFC